VEHHFTDFTKRQIHASEPEDMKIIRRLIEKALELSIKEATGHGRMHGIFLLEEPIPLYRCEKARLYLGFSTRIGVQDSGAIIEWTETKKSTLKTRMDEVATKAIHDLRIGDLSLGSDAAITEQKPDLQTQLLQETRQRLFGRNVSAWGSVLAIHDELWYFPNQIRFS
jgi:hypothetical protein